MVTIGGSLTPEAELPNLEYPYFDDDCSLDLEATSDGLDQIERIYG